MTPGARLAAAIELLDEVAGSSTPADQVLRAWGKARRFAGSTDRRVIAEQVYAALRARARLSWRMGEASGRALVLAAAAEAEGLDAAEALFSGEGHAPAPISPAERERLVAPLESEPDWVRAGLPEWLCERLQARFGACWIEEAAALMCERAPVDLRANAIRGDLDAAIRLLKQDGFEPDRTPWSAWGLRLPAELAPDIQKSRAFTTGWIEVQDEGSQLAALLGGPAPGMTVVDYCAGGGGKTLALGMVVTGTGRLVALDINRARLDAIRPRLERAGVQAEVRRIGPEGQGSEDLEGAADLVFVDAPCSGSGTWRRRPEGAWRLTPATVERLAALQRAILRRAARVVKQGGRLAYVTCSVLPEENDAVAAGFAAEHADFRPLPIAEAAATAAGLTEAARARLAELAEGAHTVQLTPRRTGADGFFIALFERPA